MNKLHRYLSFFLCLALILFCLSSPLQRSASASVAATIVIGIAGTTVSVEAVIGVVATVLVAVGFASGTVDQVISKSRTFYNNCSTSLKKWFDEVAADVIDGTSVFRIPSTVQKELKEKLDGKAPDNIPYLLIPGTLTNLASLTGSDVFIQDVIGAIEAGNSLQEITNTRLLSLYGLLNTSFADIEDFVTTQTSAISTGFTNLTSNLGTKISSLSTTLSGKLDSLETATDVMRSTVSGHLMDLKTLYSSFGSSTLTKLDSVLGKFDSLTEAIKGINGFNLSADFKSLTELETQFGNATLNSLDELYSRVSDVTSAIIDASNARSTELTNIYEVLTNGFSDLSSKLDSLTVDVPFPELDWLVDAVTSINSSVSEGFLDLSSLLQTFSSTVDLHLGDGFAIISSLLDDQFLVLDSISSALSDGFSDVSLSAESLASLNEVTNLFYESYLGISEMMQMVIDDIYFMLQEPLRTISDSLTSLDSSLQSHLSAFSDSLTSLDSSLQSHLSALEEFYFYDLLGVYESHLGDVVDFVDNMTFTLNGDLLRIESSLSSLSTFLQTDIVEVLNDIKTSIKSIAGTTTADPNPGGNNSQDEYEKEKAPLMPWVGSGFEIGGSYFNSIQGFLGDDMDAFLVAGMIFEEFAGMTFFYKLIIISCSVGLIGTLLGMALQLQGYSVAQRRREEAAQSKAHNRMERSYAA